MSDLLTTREAADELGVSRSRVQQLRDRLGGRLATPGEQTALLAASRIKAIPPTGVLVFPSAAVESFEPMPPHRPPHKVRQN